MFFLYMYYMYLLKKKPLIKWIRAVQTHGQGQVYLIYCWGCYWLIPSNSKIG